MCHVSPVTSHLYITPTATVTDPPRAKSPNMHTRLVCNEPKTREKNLKQKKTNNKKLKTKTSRGMPLLALYNSTRRPFNWKDFSKVAISRINSRLSPKSGLQGASFRKKVNIEQAFPSSKDLRQDLLSFRSFQRPPISSAAESTRNWMNIYEWSCIWLISLISSYDINTNINQFLHLLTTVYPFPEQSCWYFLAAAVRTGW